LYSNEKLSKGEKLRRFDEYLEEEIGRRELETLKKEMEQRDAQRGGRSKKRNVSQKKQ
jgi:hypothetical protein